MERLGGKGQVQHYNSKVSCQRQEYGWSWGHDIERDSEVVVGSPALADYW